MIAEVLAGLSQRPKTLPCKLLYDQRGSALFDQICELPEYTLTRDETAIMQQHVESIVDAIGPDALLIELGSGSSVKTRTLLDHLETPAAYVPVDISRDHLLATAEQLDTDYPSVEVLPLVADYDRVLTLPEVSKPARRRVIYFPGSTIGNFSPEAARRFLQRLSRLAQAGPEPEAGLLLIGLDTPKDAEATLAAYDDAAGVTAAFNLNLLTRLNREAGADFDVALFRSVPVYDRKAHRIEGHLMSRCDQEVHVQGRAIGFKAGETVWIESSHKYPPEVFFELAEDWEHQHTYTDADERFHVHLMQSTSS